MEAIEFYIGELEDALAEVREEVGYGVVLTPRQNRLMTAAEQVIIAWDAAAEEEGAVTE